MSLAHLRALIFDLDGTLIDSERDLVEATNATLRHLGRLELPYATVSSYIGHGVANLVARALGPEGRSQQTDAMNFFLPYYDQHKLDFTRAYPSVPEALAQLAPRPMAVLTNKPRIMAEQILTALGLANYFAVIYGGDSFPTTKPDPAGVHAILAKLAVAPENVLYVGDSQVDVQTARNAGIPVAVVNYGFGQRDRATLPADLYLDKLTDLLPLLTNTAS
jgi:phosphoglycolate phosphatase